MQIRRLILVDKRDVKQAETLQCWDEEHNYWKEIPTAVCLMERSKVNLCDRTKNWKNDIDFYIDDDGNIHNL